MTCLMIPKSVKETAEEIFPDLAYTEEWANNAKKLFNAAPCKARFDKNYVKNPTFYKIVNFIFKSTINYLFKDPNAINQLVDSTPFINAIYNIGRVLGVYITCLWKLEEKRQRQKSTIRISKHFGVNIYYEVNKILDPALWTLTAKTAKAKSSSWSWSFTTTRRRFRKRFGLNTERSQGICVRRVCVLFQKIKRVAIH